MAQTHRPQPDGAPVLGSGARTDLYFDFNGSTPVAPSVLQAALPYLSAEFANPSAAHTDGRRARAAIDAARATIAVCLGAEPSEIYFTSGGTESNNWALFGSAPGVGGGHFVVSAIEHKSVLSAAAELERRGHAVTYVAPSSSGVVSVAAIEQALRPDTALVSVMGANNETGCVQPVHEIGALCRARGVRFHTDMVCAFGKLDVDVQKLGCDLLSIASHKVYAPKGLGVLYVRSGVRLDTFVFGCGQQDGRRGGTENPFAVVALARAVELIRSERADAMRRVEVLRDELWRGIAERLPHCRRNGEGAFLPNTLNVRFPGRLGADLQRELGERGIAVAAGSAGAGAAPSHVLCAMGQGEEAARESLRFSLGSTTTSASIRTLLDALSEILEGAPSSRSMASECRA